MVHFDWSISIGAIIGWIITGLGCAYGLGKIAAAVEHTASALRSLSDRHETHCEDDSRHFTSIQEQLTAIATAVRSH